MDALRLPTLQPVSTAFELAKSKALYALRFWVLHSMFRVLHMCYRMAVLATRQTTNNKLDDVVVMERQGGFIHLLPSMTIIRSPQNPITGVSKRSERIQSKHTCVDAFVPILFCMVSTSLALSSLHITLATFASRMVSKMAKSRCRQHIHPYSSRSISPPSIPSQMSLSLLNPSLRSRVPQIRQHIHCPISPTLHRRYCPLIQALNLQQSRSRLSYHSPRTLPSFLFHTQTNF